MAVSEPDVDVLDSNLAGGVAIRGGAPRTLGYLISLRRVDRTLMPSFNAVLRRDPAPDNP
jgi:hypothetical protein